MRLYTYMLIGFMCFWHCSCKGLNTTTDANENTTVHNASVLGNENLNANSGSSFNDSNGIRKDNGNFRVDSYLDGELLIRSFFRNGLLIEEYRFNTQSKKKENKVKYFYNKNAEFEHLEVSKTDGTKETGAEMDKSMLDFLVQYKNLKANGVNFPIPDIVPDEVRDISMILSLVDNNTSCKTEVKDDGDHKVIKCVEFDKNVRFEPSTITIVAGNNPIHIRHFELILENNYPIKESLKTGDGELTKTYSYRGGRLTTVVYKFTDLQNQSNSLEKKFEYHELNQER